MRCTRALPINHLMPAASSRKIPVATPAPVGGLPGKTERPHLQQPARRAPHPSSCRRTSSADPDKAGRRHAPTRLPHHVLSREADMT
jgi:hypothetical protein